MRGLVVCLVMVVLGTGASAQDADDLDKCAQTEAWFMQAVDARIGGSPKGRTFRSLRSEMGRTAAEQLTEFVYSLPTELLTPEVGEAARAQCESL